MKISRSLSFITLLVLLAGLGGATAQTRRRAKRSRVGQRSVSTQGALPKDEAIVHLGYLLTLASRLESRAKVGLEPNSYLDSKLFLKDSITLSDYAEHVSGLFKDKLMADSIRRMGDSFKDAAWLFSYARRSSLTPYDASLREALEESALRTTNQQKIRDTRLRNLREGRDNSDDEELLLKEQLDSVLRDSARQSQEEKQQRIAEELKEQKQHDYRNAIALLGKYGKEDKWSEQPFAITREVFAIGIRMAGLLKQCQSHPDSCLAVLSGTSN